MNSSLASTYLTGSSYDRQHLYSPASSVILNINNNNNNGSSSTDSNDYQAPDQGLTPSKHFPISNFSIISSNNSTSSPPSSRNSSVDSMRTMFSNSTNVPFDTLYEIPASFSSTPSSATSRPQSARVAERSIIQLKNVVPHSPPQKLKPSSATSVSSVSRSDSADSTAGSLNRSIRLANVLQDFHVEERAKSDNDRSRGMTVIESCNS